MNILKITKKRNENNYNDVYVVALCDCKNNLLKEVPFDDVCEFVIDDKIDTEANRIRISNENLIKENEQLKQDIKVLNAYIDVLRRNNNEDEY